MLLVVAGPDQKMDMNRTKMSTAIPKYGPVNKPKFGVGKTVIGYRPDRNTGMNHTKKMGTIRPKYGPQRTHRNGVWPDRNIGTGQIKILEWSGPKVGYAQDQIVIGRDGNWVWARWKPELHLNYELSLTGPPVRVRSLSGPYISRVANFILGCILDINFLYSSARVLGENSDNIVFDETNETIQRKRFFVSNSATSS